MQKRFIFPKMFVKIKEHVNNCETCVAIKPDKNFKPSRSVTSTLPHPWTAVQSDIKGPLSLTLSGNRFIITFVCQLTRYSIIKPLKSKEATSVIEAISRLVGVHFPVPMHDSCSRSLRYLIMPAKYGRDRSITS